MPSEGMSKLFGTTWNRTGSEIELRWIYAKVVPREFIKFLVIPFIFIILLVFS